MFYVTQTNVPKPRRDVRNTIEEARELASKFCPSSGDTAAIYVMARIEKCTTVQTVTFDEWRDSPEYIDVNARYREEDIDSLTGDIG